VVVYSGCGLVLSFCLSSVFQRIYNLAGKEVVEVDVEVFCSQKDVV